MLFMLLQPVPAEPPVQNDFELSRAERSKVLNAPTGACRSADPNAIVICGSRGAREQYRYRDMPDRYEEKGIPQAQTGLGGDVSGRVHAEQVGLPGGTQSKRIMVTITKPF